jgi:hypothetical protein
MNAGPNQYWLETSTGALARCSPIAARRQAGKWSRGSRA